MYQIQRYRKHKIHKNLLRVLRIDGDPQVDLTKGTEKLTQALVNQIIGCSFEVFTGAVYAGQERMPDLPGMTDKNLKMLIEEASGATLLEAAYTEAQARLRTKKAEVDVANSQVVNAEAAVNTAIERLSDAEIGKDEFETARVEAVKVIHAKALLDKAAILEAKKRAAADDIPKLRAALAALDVRIAAVTSERDTERLLQVTHATKQNVLTRHDTSVETLAASVKRETLSLAKIEHNIGCSCETCAKPYSAEDIAPAKVIAQRRLDEAKKTYDAATAKRGGLAADVLSVAETLETHRASMTDVSEANAQRFAVDAKLRAALVNETTVQRLCDALAASIAQIKVKNAEINPFILRIKTAEDASTLAKAKLVERQADLERITAAFKVAETVAKVFSPAGVRAFLLDEVTPFLNDQTAKYLGTLSDGHIVATWTTLIKSAKGELREKFSIEVTNSTGGDRFGLISGGEKRKVRIACALALQDLVARRATKPIELFLGDEIDDALDPAGIERLTTILEEKARERGSVFIISHSDLKDWIRTTITVTKKGELATFSEATV